MLARRLIRGLAPLKEHERDLICRLREVYDHTGRLKQMLLDMDSAKDLQDNFHRRPSERHNTSQPKFPSSFMVLSQAHWPLHLTAPGFQAPQVLRDANSEFEDFYAGHHPGRRLTWLWQLSHGEMRMTTGDTSHILCLSAYQMAILVLFNDEQTLSSEAIGTKTGIPSEMLSVLLNRFVKVKLLRVADSKHPGSNIYSIDPHFNSKRKINLLGTPRAQKTAELQEARHKIKEDQSLLVHVSIRTVF